MWDARINPRLLKRMKIHPSLIKKAAMQIECTPRQKLYQTYNKVVDVGDFNIFLVYEFEENNIMYIKEAKRATGRKWEPTKR